MWGAHDGSNRRTMSRIVLVAGLASLLTAGAGEVRTAGQAPLPERAFFDQYCVSCHNDKLKTGGLTLENLSVSDLHASAGVLEKVVRKLRSGQMPPQGSRRPDAAALAAFVTTVETALDNAA